MAARNVDDSASLVKRAAGLWTVLCLLVLTGTTAFAQEGTAACARMERGRVDGVFGVGLDGSVLLGRYGTAPGIVELEKRDGVWSGQFGWLFISSASAERQRNGNVTVTITSAQGLLRYHLVKTRDGGWETRESLNRGPRNRQAGRLSADARTLRTGRGAGWVEMTSTDGLYYEGFSRPAFGSWIDSTGDLTPKATLTNDPVLYVLLYFIAP
jgi:hypothetical protein|tara:strand:+ start:66 stop:701 length:636 start_codon:yes stop_codon:yes gene_type:complete